MPTYAYHALAPGGRLMRGTLEVDSRQAAQQLLADMALEVQSLEKAPKPRPRTRLGRSEFLLFNRQLAALTEAGIPLERGLRELAEDVQSRSLRRVIASLADDLESGTDIEEAFAKRREHFPAMYGRIVRAGIRSGRLGEMLVSLNRHLEVASETRRIVFEALAYPVLVLVIAAILMTGLFAYVVPSLREIFAELPSGQASDLPSVTRGLIAASEHVWTIWWAIGAAFAAGLLGYWALSRTSAGRRGLERLAARIPLLGAIYRRGKLARTADAAAVLIAAGCDLPEALRLAGETAGSKDIAGECRRLAAAMQRGSGLLETGEACRWLPPFMLYSIHFGAQRNELEDNLYALSEMYAAQARQAQGVLQATLLPILLIVVGVVIGAILAGLFMPLTAAIRWAGA
jgi:type IV pilus assembly protein PilC